MLVTVAFAGPIMGVAGRRSLHSQRKLAPSSRLRLVSNWALDPEEVWAVNPCPTSSNAETPLRLPHTRLWMLINVLS